MYRVACNSCGRTVILFKYCYEVFYHVALLLMECNMFYVNGISIVCTDTVWHHMDTSGLGVSGCASLMWVCAIVISLDGQHPQIFLFCSAVLPWHVLALVVVSSLANTRGTHCTVLVWGSIIASALWPDLACWASTMLFNTCVVDQVCKKITSWYECSLWITLLWASHFSMWTNSVTLWVGSMLMSCSTCALSATFSFCG